MNYRALGLSAALAVGLAAAQDTSQTTQTTQQTQETQSQMPGMTGDMQMSGDTLQELCRVYDHLGQIIVRMGSSQMSDMSGGMGKTGGQMSDMGQAHRDALAQARADVEALQERIEAGEADQSTADEITRIRQGLNDALADDQGNRQEAVTEIDTLLGQLSEQIAAGGEADPYRTTYHDLLARFDAVMPGHQGRMNAAGQPKGQSAGHGEAERVCASAGKGTSDSQPSGQGMNEEARAAMSRRGATLEQARSDLEGLRERIEAGDAGEDVAQTVEGVRQSLREGFADADDMDRAALDETDELLGQLTEQLIAGRSEEYRDTYGGVVDRLSGMSTAMEERSGAAGEGGESGEAEGEEESEEGGDGN